MEEEYFFWRPILAKIVTYRELSTVMSLDDLAKVNALLDMREDIEKHEYMKLKKK